MRSRIPRPRGASYSFACVACRLVLDDGVEYAWCPACSRAVDWISRDRPAWACAACDALVIGGDTAPACASCAAPMARLVAPGLAASPRRPLAPRTVAWRLLATALALQAVFALAAPELFPHLAAWLALGEVAAVAVVGLAVFATPALYELARDGRTRILHGLEHATIALLVERGFIVRSGCTYDGEFVIDFVHDGRSWDRLPEIREAVASAIHRIAGGEHALAYSDRCGTSMLVGHLVLALAIAAAGAAGLAVGVPANVAFAVSVAAGFGARAIQRSAGLVAQRWLTVSTALTGGSIRAIDQQVAASGSTMRVTIAVDVVPRPRHGGAVAPTVLG